MRNRHGNVRRMGIAVVALVAGLGVFLGSAQISKAAPAGWTAADFKGTYVGHWNGKCDSVPASGIISLGADGDGSLSIQLDGDTLALPVFGYSVGGVGFVLAVDSSGDQFRAHLSDRGKRVDFWFYLTGGSCTGSGEATIQ